MAGTLDSINELLEQINSQGHKYILMIFNEDKNNPSEDVVDLYSSFSTKNLERINSVLQTVGKQEKQNNKKSRKKKNE